jgi:hypothetical protein
MNTPKYTTTRIWVETLRTFKLIAALSQESMVKVMDRLAQQELDRLRKTPAGQQLPTLENETGHESSTISE